MDKVNQIENCVHMARAGATLLELLAGKFVSARFQILNGIEPVLKEQRASNKLFCYNTTFHMHSVNLQTFQSMQHTGISHHHTHHNTLMLLRFYPLKRMQLGYSAKHIHYWNIGQDRVYGNDVNFMDTMELGD